MGTLGWIVLFSIIGGVLSLLGGVAMMFWQEKCSGIVCELTSFAAGVLIAVAVLDLLPEAYEAGRSDLVSLAVLAGILFLFLLDKSDIWLHQHHHDHRKESDHPEIVGVWLGDTLHNLIDGMAIGAAFLISVPAGIATSLAVGLHELPQEIADFSLYIRAGYSRTRTIGLNLASSLATLVGAVGVFFFGDLLGGGEVYILALAAGMFLYIALADLMPDIREHDHPRRGSREMVVFFFGLALAYMSIVLLE